MARLPSSLPITSPPKTDNGGSGPKLLSVAVAVLPVVPGGGDTVTVLSIWPVAVERMFTVKRNVAVPFTGRSIVALMSLPPVAGVTDDPTPAVVALQKPLAPCGDGRRSRTMPPLRKLGPELVTTIV